MTEAEWLTATYPAQLAMPLTDLVPEPGAVLRRSRLTVVACSRLIPRAVMPAVGPALLDAVEAWVDAGGRRPLVVGRLEKDVVAEMTALEPGWRHSLHHGRSRDRAYRAYKAATAVLMAALIYRSPIDRLMVLQGCADAAVAHPRPTPAQKTAADLLRCVFGNPFRPTHFDPVWRTATTVAIAAGAYADRGFDRLPVLADALEDAGCDIADLLAHLRGPGPHARGCWALDLVLGKT